MPRRQRVRNLGQSEIARTDLNFGGVGDDDVCSAASQFVGAAVATDPDDESEAAPPGRRCRFSRGRDDHRTARTRPQPIGGVDRRRAVDPNGKHVGDPCGVEHRLNVPISREARCRHPETLQLTDECHRGVGPRGPGHHNVEAEDHRIVPTQIDRRL